LFLERAILPGTILRGGKTKKTTAKYTLSNYEGQLVQIGYVEKEKRKRGEMDTRHIKRRGNNEKYIMSWGKLTSRRKKGKIGIFIL